MKLRGKKITFLGDSITFGYGASDDSKCYVSRLKEMLKLKEAVNLGISGTRIAQQQSVSDDKNFISRIPEIPEDSDVVVVFGGTNDHAHGNAPFGEMSDRTKDTFYGACHVLMGTLTAKFWDKKLVVCTPIHKFADEVQEGKEKNLDEYTKALREVAEYYAIPVLDFYKISRMQPKVEVIREKYMPDGIHPNDAGYKLLAEEFATFLKAL